VLQGKGENIAPRQGKRKSSEKYSGSVKKLDIFKPTSETLDRRKWEIICPGGSDVRYHAEPVSEDCPKCSVLTVFVRRRVTKDLPVIFAKRSGVQTLTSQAAQHKVQQAHT